MRVGTVPQHTASCNSWTHGGGRYNDQQRLPSERGERGLPVNEPKTWRYRLLRIGGLPRRDRRRLADEGIVVLEEGIRTTVTWRNVRLPGRRIAWRKQCFSAALVITQRRATAVAGWIRLLDVSKDDVRARAIVVTVDDRGRMHVTIDASILHSKGRGTIDYVFAVDSSYSAADALRSVLHSEGQ